MLYASFIRFYMYSHSMYAYIIICHNIPTSMYTFIQRNSFYILCFCTKSFVACKLYFHKYNYSFWLLIHNYIFNPIIKTILFVIFCLLLEAWLILTLDYRIFFSFWTLLSSINYNLSLLQDSCLRHSSTSLSRQHFHLLSSFLDLP